MFRTIAKFRRPILANQSIMALSAPITHSYATKKKTSQKKAQKVRQSSRRGKSKRPVVYEMSENEHMSYIYDMRNRYIEMPTNLPEPCQYTGRKNVNVSFVLTRLPQVTPDKHPLSIMEGNLSMKERNRESRHSYADFWGYAEAWEQLFRTRRNKNAGKKKKKKNEKKAKVGRTRPKKERVGGALESWTLNRLLGRAKIDESVLHFWNTFQPQMRYTQADFDDERTTMQRKLMHHLYLIVYDEETNTWKFPEYKLANRETLTYAAQKNFHEQFGDELFGFFDSNAPIGHVDLEDNKQVFFMACEYMTGALPESYTQKHPTFAWVTKEELQDYTFPSEEYLERIQKMLQ